MVDREHDEELSALVDDPAVWDVEPGDVAADADAWHGAGPQSIGGAATQRNSALANVQSAHDVADAFANGSPRARKRARIMGLLMLAPFLLFVLVILVFELTS